MEIIVTIRDTILNDEIDGIARCFVLSIFESCNGDEKLMRQEFEEIKNDMEQIDNYVYDYEFENDECFVYNGRDINSDILEKICKMVRKLVLIYFTYDIKEIQNFC